MLIIKVHVTSFGENWAFGEYIDSETDRIDTMICRNESLPEKEILERVKAKYIGHPIRFNCIHSILLSGEDPDKYFANMGEI